jgi:hypothetical protein
MQESTMFPIHHILPQSLAGHHTLGVIGNRFNVDGIKNLMALPPRQNPAQELTSSPHTGGHVGSYSKIFCKFLVGLQSHPSFAAAQAGDSAARDQLNAELNRFVGAAKHALARGHLLANSPSGMTPENANKRNEDWFANWEAYAKDHWDSIQQVQETVDQLYDAGRREGALYWPILSPDGTLSLADKIAISQRYLRDTPISQQFTVVGPVPDLPGLVPPVVNTQLPGFIPPPLGDLNRPEGFTPGNPLLSYGVPGFPAINPQAFGQLPPTTAIPQDPLVLKFDPATGAPLPFSERSPILDPDPPLGGSPPASLYAGAGLATLAVLVPEFLPLWARMGAAALTASVPGLASAGAGGGGVFSTGTLPYDPFRSGQASANGSDVGYVAGATSAQWPREDMRVDQGSTAMRPMDAPKPEASSSVTAVAPDEVRRLTRVNASNAGSVFTSGSAPVPYLPSTEFNDRFGSWSMPTAGRPQQASRPIGAFADEPSYLVPPPIFGADAPVNTHNDAQEWFSRWIGPLLRSE